MTPEQLEAEARRVGMSVEKLKALIEQKTTAPQPVALPKQYAGGSIGADHQANNWAAAGMSDSQMGAARRNRVSNVARYGQATPSFGAMTSQNARNNDALQGVQGITDGAITSLTTAGPLALKGALASTALGRGVVGGANRLGGMAMKGKAGMPVRLAHNAGKKLDPSFARLANTEGGKIAGDVVNKVVSQTLLKPSKDAAATGKAASVARKSGVLPGYARVLAPYAMYLGS
tara:strand:- start:4885 stop:5580 length:696 start_codon:yes stop_codon:yes gene_type:complete